MGSNERLNINYPELKGHGMGFADAFVSGLTAGLFGSNLLRQVLETVSSIGGLTEDDVTNVSRLIEAGSEKDVSEMKIEMNREQWVGVKGGLNIGGGGAEVEFGTSGSTGYSVEVKYK